MCAHDKTVLICPTSRLRRASPGDDSWFSLIGSCCTFGAMNSVPLTAVSLKKPPFPPVERSTTEAEGSGREDVTSSPSSCSHFRFLDALCRSTDLLQKTFKAHSTIAWCYSYTDDVRYSMGHDVNTGTPSLRTWNKTRSSSFGRVGSRGYTRHIGVVAKERKRRSRVPARRIRSCRSVPPQI